MPLFLRVCSTSLLKTLREKEKLLVTSNFSFSHNVFYPSGELSAIFIKFEIVVCTLFQFRRVSFGKVLTSFQECNIAVEKGAIVSSKASFSTIILGSNCIHIKMKFLYHRVLSFTFSMNAAIALIL